MERSKGLGQAAPSSAKSGAESGEELLRIFQALKPRLRAAATLWVRSAEDAEDLVQEALLKAWKYRTSCRMDTNPEGWLFRILRNEFLSWVVRPRPLQDTDGRLAARLVAPDDLDERANCADVVGAVMRLTPRSRDALMLIAAGNSYEEVSALWGCSIGAVKSRVNRARHSLVDILGDAPAPPEHVDGAMRPYPRAA